MSYRNDHDAALARIDALEAELGKNSDARERFTTLELQLATAKAERDRARAALERQEARGGSLMIPMALGAVALMIVGGFAIAVRAAAHHPTTSPPPPPPAPALALAKAERTAELMACVATLDGAVASHVAVSPSCVGAIGRQAADPSLGDDIHQILTAWYAAETRLAVSHDETAARDALVERIQAYVIPSYTR